MVMRDARHHPESVRAGVEILDRVPAGVGTIGCSHACRGRYSNCCKWLKRKWEGLVAGAGFEPTTFGL